MHLDHSITTAAPFHVGADRVPWQEVDRHLRRISRARGVLDAEEARWLLVARETRLHEQYGYATLREYMERILGYGPHAAGERLRVAESLQVLPLTREALAAGRVSYSAVRELTRIAEPWTEEELLAHTADFNLRQIEAFVSGREKGDTAADPVKPELIEHRLHFRVQAATYALYRDARLRLENEHGHALDESEVLAALCRSFLGASQDPGRATHQIAVTVCESCGRAWQDGAGQPVEVPPQVLERAECDAQFLGRTDAQEPERAHQATPPAVRRLVFRRDHGRCVVPGCRSSRYLDCHHVVFRAHGGASNPANVALVCGAHHDAIHDGRIIVEGSAPDLTFTRADGRPYTSHEPLPQAASPTRARSIDARSADARAAAPPAAAPPPAAPTATASTTAAPTAPGPARSTLDHDVALGLRSLGYTAPESRAAVAQARSHVGAVACPEDLFRASLAALRKPTS